MSLLKQTGSNMPTELLKFSSGLSIMIIQLQYFILIILTILNLPHVSYGILQICCGKKKEFVKTMITNNCIKEWGFKMLPP